MIAVLVLGTTISINGRVPQPQEQRANPAQSTETADPIEQLRLTPEQRQRIRIITQETKDERQMINRRVRESNIALEQALDADVIDENLIEQRVNDLATAQAAQMRLRIQTELRIRRILRPEQLATWRLLRLQARDLIGGQRQNNQRRPATQGLRPNQGNGIAPVFPRRDGLPRNPRP
jgi:Spy/CpxP family protein refolding chaperone